MTHKTDEYCENLIVNFHLIQLDIKNTRAEILSNKLQFF